MARLVRYAELLPRYGITFSRMHLRRLIAASNFPSPVKLGENTIAWIETDISAWIDGLRADRDHLASLQQAAGQATAGPAAEGGHCRTSG